MTRQRRTHLFILALVPVVVFGAIRCADAPSAPSPSTKGSPVATIDPVASARLSKLHAKFDWVGDFHNDALKFVLAKLQRLPQKGASRQRNCETAIAAYAEFHRARRGVEMPADTRAAAEKRCAAPGASPIAGLLSLSAPTETSRDEFSAEAQSSFDRILSSLDGATSLEDLDARIASIDASAASTLSEAEAGAVVTVGAVASSSARYWDANLVSWLPYVSNSPEQSVGTLQEDRVAASPTLRPNSARPYIGYSYSISPLFRRVVRGDITGAISAVIRAGFLGVVIEYDTVIAGAAVGSIMPLFDIF